MPKTPKKRGRKQGHGQSIKKEQFEELCKIFCTKEETLAVLGVCETTLNSWVKETYEGKNYQEVAESFRDCGKASLRRIQIDLAKKSSAVAIWLGKQYLGQTDKMETTTEERIEFVSDVPKV